MKHHMNISVWRKSLFPIAGGIGLATFFLVLSSSFGQAIPIRINNKIKEG
ncbi:MAG: hypothetical protein ACYDEE_02550 [Ignavibacteriaceae bacterium]